ncbi:MAG: LPS export ABC transporter periplasmic protein LptC [Treponema sp.]|nr:LPS export ABC transporter periplasmic protein LptC [Treponema sp.]
MALAPALASCSFDYGDRSGDGQTLPDLVMEDVEYVRVRAREIQARVVASRAARFENQRRMELSDFSFEQFEGGRVSAFGAAGAATVELDTMNVVMAGGVRLEVVEEEIAIETSALRWRDEQRMLSGEPQEEVRIFGESGTDIVGVGFSADARRREWEFQGAVAGSYAENEDEGGEE